MPLHREEGGGGGGAVQLGGSKCHERQLQPSEVRYDIVVTSLHVN